MTFAIGHHPGNHTHLPHHDHPHGDGWKFGLAALAMTAAGTGFVYSPLMRNDSPDAEPASIPAVEFLEPVITRLVVLPSENAKDAIVAAPEPAPVIAAQSAGNTQATAPAATSVQPSIPPVTADAKELGASIHDVDFTTLPLLQAMASQLGGRVDPAQIKYADLTRDGSEEAVVPITSDGTAGNLAFVVFTIRAGKPSPILTRLAAKDRRGLVPTFNGSQVAETSGIYGPNDPNCCPSQLVKTYFHWDGLNLVPDRTETINIPQGKLAD